MNEKSDLLNNLVSIAYGDTPEDTLKRGIENLGGLLKFINKGDNVFIKVHLRIPELFPLNFNFDSLTQLINSCKNAGAQKVIIGGYTDQYINRNAFEQILGYQAAIESLGAELEVFQEDEDIEYIIKELKEKTIKIPKVIMESNKLISLNQVGVNPIFQVDLSLLNSYSIISPNLQKVEKLETQGRDYHFIDQYKRDLISNILEVYNLRKPDLVINDLYYFLENAGPYVYKDSKIKRTNIMVLGTDALSVDIVTLSLLDLDYLKNPLTSEARFRSSVAYDLKNIKLVGENLEERKIDIKLPVSKLEAIDVLNTAIKTGKYCCGCFEAAYRFLNFIKTNMVKDLKYLVNQSFLVGDNPQKPDSSENVILFGDCAIKSTKDRDFRKVIIKKSESFTFSRKINKKKYSKDKRSKLKEILNKRILELAGCPPSFYNNLYQFIKYYGKENCPNGVFYFDLIKTYLEKTKFEVKLK